MTDLSTTCAEAIYHLTLKLASAQVVETPVTNNSPSQDSNNPDDLFQSWYVTPGFKPLIIFLICENYSHEYFQFEQLLSSI